MNCFFLQIKLWNPVIFSMVITKSLDRKKENKAQGKALRAIKHIGRSSDVKKKIREGYKGKRA